MNRLLSERHPTIRCKAHSSRTGEPCKRWASVGSTVCSTHGASAPQVKKTAEHIKQTAEERIQALVPKAIARIEALIDGAENETVALNASKDMLDRAGLKAPEKVDATLQVDDVTGLSETDRATRILAIVQRARERADRALGSAESDLDATTGATD